MYRHLAAAALMFAAPSAIGIPAAAAEQPYLTAAQVDLVRLLPPPPAVPEIAEVLAAQSTRTPARIARAIADIRESVFDMYGSALGPGFIPQAVPLATRVFERLGDTEEVVVAPIKRHYARKRPFMVSDEIRPVVPPSSSGSYPSGHSTRSTMEGIVLAAMVPERRDAIFARMLEYRQSRLIGGVHFPSDIEAGARAGIAIAAVLFNDPGFVADYNRARPQLRAALGYAP